MKWSVLSALLSFFTVNGAWGFDVINTRESYSDNKFVSLGAGMGFTGFARESGIQGGTGFGFKVSAGHHFTPYLEGEFIYQFSTFRLSSPDPVAPNQNVSSRAAMNQELIRVLLKWPAVLAQPYVGVGVGGYNLFAVNSETALSFPANFQLPVFAGIRSYVYRNRISLDLDFSYQFLFGENQPSDILTLLSINEVEFDTYSFMTSFTFHFL